MYNSILVPIDISEDSLTHMVIPFVQAHTALNTAKVHFLTVIPSLPYYSSLGLAYSVEMPKLKEFQHVALEKLEEIVKQFKIPPDKIQTHALTGAPKDESSLTRSMPTSLLSLPTNLTYRRICWVRTLRQWCGMRNALCWL